MLCTAQLPHPLLAGVCTDLGAIIPFSPWKILFQGTKYVKCVTKAETDLEENRKFNFYISFLLSSFGRKGLLSALGIKITLSLDSEEGDRSLQCGVTQGVASGSQLTAWLQTGVGAAFVTSDLPTTW